MRDEWNSEEDLLVVSWRKCSFGKVLLLKMSMMYEKATLLLLAGGNAAEQGDAVEDEHDVGESDLVVVSWRKCSWTR
jgi:hypothetical protein